MINFSDRSRRHSTRVQKNVSRRHHLRRHRFCRRISRIILSHESIGNLFIFCIGYICVLRLEGFKKWMDVKLLNGLLPKQGVNGRILGLKCFFIDLNKYLKTTVGV